MNEKIIILGGGVTALGAAWRLKELGHDNYKIFEKNNYLGGLANSFLDDKGFTWDVGGHIQFSHYPYFDKVMDDVLKDEWLHHQRESWIWIKDRFVPYPFQNNIKYLEKEDIVDCLNGLIESLKNKESEKPKNFEDWIISNFGAGIANLFMLPYNYKVWAYKPNKLSYNWIGERVSVVDVSRVIKNVVYGLEDLSWGPNAIFRFPKKGGTGEIWKRVSNRLPQEKIFLDHKVIKVDLINKEVYFENGLVERYDYLISTIPLDQLLIFSDFKEQIPLESLKHSSTHIFGIGLSGKPSYKIKTKCWMYFPESNCPFYRVTVFSNYSPNNVPDIKNYWSLMAEVSESPEKPVNPESIKEEVIQGLINTQLISSRDEIVDFWHHFEDYGYPTPSLNRDLILPLLEQLKIKGVYSRGRFGAWRYEVSNQDHSFMQGVEAIDNILSGKEEVTIWHPEIVNAKK